MAEEILDLIEEQDKTEIYSNLAIKLREAQARLKELLNSSTPNEQRIAKITEIIDNLSKTLARQ